MLLSYKWSNQYFLPYDFGYYAFIYDSNKIKNPPKSMKEFLDDKGSIIYQDPRTSTVGFGLLLWLEKLYGKDSAKAWEKITKKTITVPKGWSEAYNMFLEGESDYVLSYTTSPAYHLIAEKKDNYKAIAFSEGNYKTKDFQKHIPTGNWMYPVIDIKLPADFAKLPKVKALSLPSKEVSQNRKTWLKDWQKATIK